MSATLIADANIAVELIVFPGALDVVAIADNFFEHPEIGFDPIIGLFFILHFYLLILLLPS